jgi:hypothetical protein
MTHAIGKIKFCISSMATLKYEYIVLRFRENVSYRRPVLGRMS